MAEGDNGQRRNLEYYARRYGHIVLAILLVIALALALIREVYRDRDRRAQEEN